jgi:hypothetical protein
MFDPTQGYWLSRLDLNGEGEAFCPECREELCRHGNCPKCDSCQACGPVRPAEEAVAAA